MHSTLIEALEHHVAVRGDTVFTRHLLADEVQELTFGEFSVLADTFAAHFAAEGVRKGEVVLILLPASPDVLPAFVGAMMIGAVPSLMPLPSAKQHPSVYWPSHHKLLDRIQPRLLLTDAEHAAQMVEHGMTAEGRTIVAIETLPDDIAPAVRASATTEDVALLQHSSGTTSLKKGVALSHGAILRQVRSYAERLGAGAEDAVVSWLPIYHDMGLIACSIVPLVLGQTVTILDPFQWVARPATLFDAIERYDGRFVWLPNFALEHMTRAVPKDYAGNLSGIRALVDCSEPCKTDTFDRFADRFAGNGVRRDQLHVSYAMAETVFAVTQTTPGTTVGSLTIDRDAMQRDRVAVDAVGDAPPFTVLSNGPVIDGITISIRDDGAVLGENRIGEIVVQGEFLFDGYFNDEALTAERLIDGWYHTRDMGFLRNGELYVLGRKDDLLIVNGRNIHAHEVEEIVGALPGLKPGRAVAFGVYNDTTASEELVIVAERDAAAAIDPAEIGRNVREGVFDRTNIDVKDFAVVDPGWLVKTTSGKISRERNKMRYLGMEAGLETVDTTQSTGSKRAERQRAFQVAPVSDEAEKTLRDIRRIIARLFRCSAKRVTHATVASDINGWDSLAHSSLIVTIEQELRVRFPDEEIFSFENVGALAERTAELRAIGLSDDDTGRVIAENENFSILKMGECGDGPDLVIFAGAQTKFGGQNMMDFASTLRGTVAENSRRFFITDRHRHWFTDSFDEIAAAINAASDGPKIVIGNSMGGYGALAIAPRLTNVSNILAFAPQRAPKTAVAKTLGRNGEAWYVRPSPGVPTCIIYGEVEDVPGKEWVWSQFTDSALHTLLRLNNAGHNVVTYLNKKGLLRDILVSALDPLRMGDDVRRIVESVEPSEEDLRDRIRAIGFSKMGPALAYLNQRYPKAPT